MFILFVLNQVLQYEIQLFHKFYDIHFSYITVSHLKNT